jgi:transcriptional regulator with XRE-family HTH domain
MSTNVSIKDVAEAAGVSKSTVSRVINGQGKATRISPATQERVRAVARQLGYRTNLVAQNISLGKGNGLSPSLPEQEASRKLTGFIGLVLSTASQTDALALIPSLDPVLTAAGYRLIVITVPADPAAYQARVTELLTAGIAGFLCCPTIYPAVMKAVAGTRPVIVLWAGAAKAVVGILNGESVEQETPSKPVVTAPPPIATPTVTPITPHPTQTPTTPAPLPQPVAIPKPVIVTPPLVFTPTPTPESQPPAAPPLEVPTPVLPPPSVPPVVEVEDPPPAVPPETPPVTMSGGANL